MGRVVDDPVGSDGRESIELVRSVDRGHTCAGRLRELHDEGSDPACGAVDEDMVAGLDVALQVQSRPGDEP